MMVLNVVFGWVDDLEVNISNNHIFQMQLWF